MRDMNEIGQVIEELTKQPQYMASLKRTVNEIIHYPPIQDFIQVHEDQLSQAMIENSLSKLNEFRRENEAYQRGEPGQNPGFRPELFINQTYIDVTYVPTQDYLEAQEEKHLASFIDNRMMSRDVRQATLESVDRSSQERLALIDRLLTFIGDYKEDPYQAKGLYLTGSFGVGKTYILGALANYLASQEVAVQMLHYPSFATDLKDSFQDQTTHQIIDRVRRQPVLIIDDIGAERNTAWLRDEVLTTILEYRMKESLATFFTSNFNMEELADHLANTKEGLASTKAARIMERIYYLADEYTLTGPNRRRSKG